MMVGVLNEFMHIKNELRCFKNWEETKARLQHELWTTLQSSPDITLDDLRVILEAITPGSAGFMVGHKYK